MLVLAIDGGRTHVGGEEGEEVAQGGRSSMGTMIQHDDARSGRGNAIRQAEWWCRDTGARRGELTGRVGIRGEGNFFS